DSEPALRDEEITLMVRIFREHATATRPVPSSASIRPTFERVMAILRTHLGAAPDLMNLDKLTPQQHLPFCAGFAALYDEVLKLPREEAVPVLRYLFEAARAGVG